MSGTSKDTRSCYSVDLQIARLSLQRLVREIAYDVQKEINRQDTYRWTKGALTAIQDAAEDYLTHLVGSCSCFNIMLTI